MNNVVSTYDATPINIYDMARDKSEEEIDGQNAESKLEDQIAMESVNQHLKKISQIPSGLKHKIDSDLIRKLTSVLPEPISKLFHCVNKVSRMFISVDHGTTTARPEILIKHRVRIHY